METKELRPQMTQMDADEGGEKFNHGEHGGHREMASNNFELADSLALTCAEAEKAGYSVEAIIGALRLVERGLLARYLMRLQRESNELAAREQAAALVGIGL
jgi:hypothetical protein